MASARVSEREYTPQRAFNRTTDIAEMTLRYNQDLLDGELAMTRQEMAGLLEEKGLAADRKCADCIQYNGAVPRDERHIFCKETGFLKVHKSSAATCEAYTMIQEKKYTDSDMAAKNAEIERLEDEIVYLKAALSQVVYDGRMRQRYGVNWKALRADVEVIQKPKKAQLGVGGFTDGE